MAAKGTEGTGLGLFIANKIAQEHDGTITVESEINKGTCFRVSLPKKRLEKKSGESDNSVVKEEDVEE